MGQKENFFLRDQHAHQTTGNPEKAGKMSSDSNAPFLFLGRRIPLEGGSARYFH